METLMDKTIKIDPTMMDPMHYHHEKVKEAAHKLLEADEIRKNDQLMGHVHNYFKDHQKKIKSLDDLKAHRGDNKFKSDQDDALDQRFNPPRKDHYDGEDSDQHQDDKYFDGQKKSKKKVKRSSPKGHEHSDSHGPEPIESSVRGASESDYEDQ